MPDFDVVVVGAGASGLAAFAELDRAGLRVLCVEARDRIGGRIFTVRDPFVPIPIELGAEFIHGRPPETWNLVRQAGLSVYDCVDAAVQIENGVLQTHEDAWAPATQILHLMREAARSGKDETFASFLERCSQSERAKKRSTSFVEGFNAAHKEVIGIASLAQDAEAAERIEGDLSFRLLNGYDSVARALFREVKQGPAKLLLNHVLKRVQWRRGLATLHVASQLSGAARTITTSRVLVTVPLGVLQAQASDPGCLQWEPLPKKTLEAARALAFGRVIRMVFSFERAFWEDDHSFRDAGFLLSDEPVFPAWWTPLAVRAPVLTAWSAGPNADPLLGKSKHELVTNAMRTLARLTGQKPEDIVPTVRDAYWHDWQADPFSRGAYSYVPAGALQARQVLAEPVDDTLFFAGEATELEGHSATVHGAIASGWRAAAQISQKRDN